MASQAGERRAAILFSLVSSCKVNAVEPWAYLRDVFTRLPSLRAEALEDLLPDRWLQSHSECRRQAADLRQAERAGKAR